MTNKFFGNKIVGKVLTNDFALIIIPTELLETILLGGYKMKKLKQAHGNWVEGDHFWDREQEIKVFIDRIEEGAHILLVAQRRIGKTSLMREVARRIQDRYICLHVDLQKSFSPADAVVELSMATRPHRKLWAKTVDMFRNILDTVTNRIESLKTEDITITFRSGMTSGDWQNKGDQLFDAFAESERPVVMFFDEVPILLNRMLKGNDYTVTPERIQQAEAFMSWLRENSIRHKEKVRIILAGSIGIEPILRQVGLSATINTFSPFELKPWDSETAIGCLEALANQYGVIFQNGALEMIIEKLGCCIPHHVQMFFDCVLTECKLSNLTKVSRDLVDEVYNHSMLSIRGHAELSHLEERLKMVLGEEVYPFALELLTEAAVVGKLEAEAASSLSQSYEFKGRSSKEVLREILGIMEHDGYLRKVGNEYVFISNLVRDWWKAHFDFGYIPALRRRS